MQRGEKNVFLQVHDFLFQPFDGHGLGDHQQIALPGIGFVCQRLCFKHDFRIGFPTGDRAFDALASHDFRIKTCAGENTGRTVAAQILRHATHLKFLRVRDAVHGSSLHRGQGVQVIHLGLSKTTTHDGSPCVICG